MWKPQRPPAYVLASVLISLGGVLNGYDTGSIGAVSLMPYFETHFGALSSIMRGFTVSLIMIAGAFPAVFAGQLADRYGHLPIITLGASVFAVGAVLEAAAPTLPALWVGRILCGMGEGLCYITEIAPAAKRGALVSVPQLLTNAGICIGYFTCYGSVHIQSNMSWRTPFIIQAILAVVLAVSCMTVMPSSPRWLMLNGSREAAIHAIEKLDIPRAEAEKDILRVPEPQAGADDSVLEGFLIIFRRQYRARTVLAFFTLGMVQLSGIDGVLYYAPILFNHAGLPAQTAGFLASGLSAILMLLISIPAVLLADRWGRRTSIITGGILLSGCMFLIGALYAADAVHSTGSARWVVIVLIFVFALSYCMTWGVVGKIYASEIQPAKTRAAANSMAQGLGFFTNWLVAFVTPVLLSSSSYGAYFIFGSLTFGTLLVLTVCMPETQGKPLENIQEAFSQRSAAVDSFRIGLLRRLRWRGSRQADESDTIELRQREYDITESESSGISRSADLMASAT